MPFTTVVGDENTCPKCDDCFSNMGDRVCIGSAPDVHIEKL